MSWIHPSDTRREVRFVLEIHLSGGTDLEMKNEHRPSALDVVDDHMLQTREPEQEFEVMAAEFVGLRFALVDPHEQPSIEPGPRQCDGSRLNFRSVVLAYPCDQALLVFSCHHDKRLMGCWSPLPDSERIQALGVGT